MDQPCHSNLLPRRTRTHSEPKGRTYAQGVLDNGDRKHVKAKGPSRKNSVVSVHHDSLDMHSCPIDRSNQSGSSLRGGLSGIGHAVDGFCFFRRKSWAKSVGGRSSSVSPEQIIHEKDMVFGSRSDINETLDHKPFTAMKIPRWLLQYTAATFRPRRRLRPVPETCYGPSSKPSHFLSPLPGSCLQPPRIPDNLESGAAARAAAATQNEILESVRNLVFVESKIPRDSESGIGIDLRDRSEEDEDEVVRKDFVHILPEEMVVHILSYLDATSLMNVELVSRRWHRSATSNHIWRQIFRNEFGFGSQLATKKQAQLQIGGAGLGNQRPDQDWKSMWRARKALNQRWQDGYAAAIYLDGHSDCVYCVQFDEHKILTGSRDRTVRVWDAHTYECIQVLGVPTINGVPTPPFPASIAGRGQRPFKRVFPPPTSIEPAASSSSLHHQGSILCLQYNEDRLVTGSSDCTCIVWDVKAGYRPLRRLRHHVAGVLDVCFDSKHIVTCSKDTMICLWDQETGDFLRKLSGHRGPVNAIQMRGDLVVSASGDGVAKLWNLTSGLCIKEFQSKDRGMACVEFSPDARTILAGGNDQVIYQFNTSTGELMRELNGHKGLVRSLHLDSANGRVVSGSYDTSVKAYDLGNGKNIVDFMGWTTSWILSAKADYRRIIATSQDRRIVVMDFGFELPGIELLAG